MGRLSAFVRQLCKEPPCRIITKAVLKRLPVSLETQDRWELTERPPYFAGVLAAAKQAKEEAVRQVSVFEFGVASGNGLLALAHIAAMVEAGTGVRIAVYGFDTGAGLPTLCADYRDYPDHWKPGDYPMDEAALRSRLPKNTALIIGNIAETVAQHVPQIREPIGFVAVDVDLYSSTRDLSRMFTLPAGRCSDTCRCTLTTSI